MLSLLFMLACDQPIPSDTAQKSDIVEQELPCINIKGFKACDIESFDKDGNIVNLYDFEGSPIILDISAAWCGPCKMAAEEVQYIQDKYSDEGLQYITLLFENTSGEAPDEQDLINWHAQNEIVTAPVWGGNRDMLVNNPISTAEGYYMTALPTFYYINESMQISIFQQGYGEGVVENHVERLLNEDY